MRRLARLRALSCLFLFVGMGSVAPVLDAALFHRAAGGPPTHIESRDNPACHFERCVMPLVQATSAGAPAARAQLSLQLSPAGENIVVPGATFAVSRLAGSHRSRAPPSLLA